MDVKLIAHTGWHGDMLDFHEAPYPTNGQLFTAEHEGWIPEGSGSEAEEIIEFAGRACYQSWHKPNPATATTPGYIGHIVSVGHYSVLEHASATFYITGVSRALTHELIRHRHLSFSQLSQRFVNSSSAEHVVPPGFSLAGKDGTETAEGLETLQKYATADYESIARYLEQRMGHIEDKTLRRKRAREAARCVLPNMTETKIVVTGNFRAWRDVIALRADDHADLEIQILAKEILRQLHVLSPSVFEDLRQRFLGED